MMKKNRTKKWCRKLPRRCLIASKVTGKDLQGNDPKAQGDVVGNTGRNAKLDGQETDMKYMELKPQQCGKENGIQLLVYGRVQRRYGDSTETQQRYLQREVPPHEHGSRKATPAAQGGW